VLDRLASRTSTDGRSQPRRIRPGWDGVSSRSVKLRARRCRSDCHDRDRPLPPISRPARYSRRQGSRAGPTRGDRSRDSPAEGCVLLRLLGGSGGALRGSARKWWSPRPREHWKPDGQLLGWKWRERVGHGAEIMGGVRFVRNSVHHQWQTRSVLTALAGRRTSRSWVHAVIATPAQTEGLYPVRSPGVREVALLGG
jgi:hypothetical protein